MFVELIPGICHFGVEPYVAEKWPTDQNKHKKAPLRGKNLAWLKNLFEIDSTQVWGVHMQLTNIGDKIVCIFKTLKHFWAPYKPNFKNY